MLSILRSRPSQILVALLCALVLSRTPALWFAEDAISSIVKVEEAAPFAVVTTCAIGLPVCVSAIVPPIHVLASCDPWNRSLTESSVLRL
jgi:hypothetical protein